uniref:Uncharacterized protein n=2 Tax=Cacopsylla melanoneura TaxID=428564 RepID=A0A8D8U287_9HEMI
MNTTQLCRYILPTICRLFHKPIHRHHLLTINIAVRLVLVHHMLHIRVGAVELLEDLVPHHVLLVLVEQGLNMLLAAVLGTPQLQLVFGQMEESDQATFVLEELEPGPVGGRCRQNRNQTLSERGELLTGCGHLGDDRVKQFTYLGVLGEVSLMLFQFPANNSSGFFIHNGWDFISTCYHHLRFAQPFSHSIHWRWEETVQIPFPLFQLILKQIPEPHDFGVISVSVILGGMGQHVILVGKEFHIVLWQTMRTDQSVQIGRLFHKPGHE